MIVPFDKILTNLAYKAPELKLQYLAAELLDYVQEVKLLQGKLATMQQLDEQHLATIDSQAARIAELETEIALCPLCRKEGGEE